MRIISILFLLFGNTGFISAQNLLNNGGFHGGGSLNWRSILSVDYYSVVDGTALAGQEGRVYPADGNGCVGVRAFSRSSDDWQEYIYQRVDNKLKADTVYRVSIKYRLAPRCQYGTDALGIGFFSGYTDYSQITQELIREKDPEIRNPPGNFLENNDAYHELVGYYTATGEENYVVFGSFATDATMFRAHISKQPPYNGAWAPEYGTGHEFQDILYYLDMASIVPCVDYPADPFPDQRVFCTEQMTQLSAPPVENAQFLWSTGDTTPTIQVHAHNQEIWLEITKNGCVRKDRVKLAIFSGKIDLGEDRVVCSGNEFPITFWSNAQHGEKTYWNSESESYGLEVSEAGTYWVEKTLDDCKARDTITITSLENAAVLFPNPVDQSFSIQNGEHAVILYIRSEDGKQVFKGEQPIEEVGEILSGLTPAVYFVTSKIGECIVEDTFVKIRN